MALRLRYDANSEKLTGVEFPGALWNNVADEFAWKQR